MIKEVIKIHSCGFKMVTIGNYSKNISTEKRKSFVITESENYTSTFSGIMLGNFLYVATPNGH